MSDRLAATALLLSIACSNEKTEPLTGESLPAMFAPVDAARSGHALLDDTLRAAHIELVIATPELATLDSTACAVTRGTQCVRCKLASEVPEDHYTQLARALEVAPRAFYEASALKRIVLCEELSFRGKHGAAPGGTIDPARGALLLQTSVLADHAGHVVQHEIFHLFDIATPTRDKPWLALNPRGFRYGARNEPPPGFVRAYSTTNVREDKATVYEALITNQLCGGADDIVLAKARLLRDRIREAIGDAASYLDTLAPCLAR